MLTSHNQLVKSW